VVNFGKLSVNIYTSSMINKY